MDGKFSEIIDNVIDSENFINKAYKLDNLETWNNLTYVPISNKKPEGTETTNKKEEKILNENLFKNKGFRSNMDEFFKNNEDTLSLSGINEINDLSELPNVFTCNKPRPNTKRYKRAMKNKNEDSFNNINNSIIKSMQNNKKNLPKLKKQIEEQKNFKNYKVVPINCKIKTIIDAEKNNDNK